jgi:putative nucleotidyltransferase with HDIG domain
MRPGESSGSAFDRDWTEWIESDDWRSSIDTVPMIPAVAREVLGFANDPTVPVKRLVKVVGKEPILASRVLRLANSAYSGSAVQITSISGAIVRMGTETIRNLVTATCVASILTDKGQGSGGRDLVDHGIGTAYIASFIADAAGESREQAFVCGLLHDIGKMLIYHLAHHPQRGVRKPTPEELGIMMAKRHAEFGGHMMRLWNLPTPLHEAVRFHHEPALADDPRPAAVTYAANRLAHRFAFGCPAEDVDLMADPVFAAAGVQPATITHIKHQAPMLYEVARQLHAA